MHFAFRTDASLQIGSGHVMRCLTLADALRERGASCTFVCRPFPGHLLDLIEQRGHQALALPELHERAQLTLKDTAHAHWLGTDWATDAQDTQQTLSSQVDSGRVDWLVVDHYALDVRWEDALRFQSKRIMVIDDLADRLHACDLLLDQNLGRKEADYVGLIKGKTITLIGPYYALVRPEFAAMRVHSLARRQRNSQLRHLLVTMGGVDKYNSTGQVLAVLQSCNLPADLRVTVVLGPHSPWVMQVQAQAAQMPWHTEVVVGVKNMAQLMAESDLAIGAAGSTLWECCSLGLPSLVLVLAQNQMPSARALQAAEAIVAMQSPQQISNFLEQMLSPRLTKKLLTNLSRAAAAVTDGEGCQRIVAYMHKDVYD
jgi:UDP-2,4-diacetamido-2,4,6-trideoxy-beta-L-altropyranose hydrolase